MTLSYSLQPCFKKIHQIVASWCSKYCFVINLNQLHVPLALIDTLYCPRVLPIYLQNSFNLLIFTFSSQQITSTKTLCNGAKPACSYQVGFGSVLYDSSMCAQCLSNN